LGREAIETPKVNMVDRKLKTQVTAKPGWMWKVEEYKATGEEPPLQKRRL